MQLQEGGTSPKPEKKKKSKSKDGEQGQQGEDDDEDWSCDVSEEAVRARREQVQLSPSMVELFCCGWELFVLTGCLEIVAASNHGLLGVSIGQALAGCLGLDVSF